MKEMITLPISTCYEISIFDPYARDDRGEEVDNFKGETLDDILDAAAICLINEFGLYNSYTVNHLEITVKVGKAVEFENSIYPIGVFTELGVEYPKTWLGLIKERDSYREAYNKLKENKLKYEQESEKRKRDNELKTYLELKKKFENLA